MKNNIVKISAGTFLMVLTALFSSNNAMAQEKTWSISPEIGANFSKYGRDYPANDFKPGLLTGVGLTYSIVNTFGITGKALFSQKGSKYTALGATNKQTLNYLEIPLIGRFFLNKEGRFRPNIFLGPSFGFLLSGTNKIGDADAKKIENIGNFYNKFDFGLTGGLGLNFEIANETRLLIDARYTHGLSDITKGAGSINNQAIGVTVGVSFGF